jgi:hypothetical protein
MPTFIFVVITVILIVIVIVIPVTVIVVIIVIIFAPTEVLSYVRTPSSHCPRPAWYMTFEMGSYVIQPRRPVMESHPTKTTWTSTRM